MRDRGMNEGEASHPHDEPSLGHAGAAEGKRRHVASARMKEYLQQQGQTVPQKQRKCPYSTCNKVFSSAPGLRYHVTTVHATTARKFSCNRCQKDFKSHNGLKYHRQRTKCQEMETNPPHPPTLSDLSVQTSSGDATGVFKSEPPVPSPLREGVPPVESSSSRRKSIKPPAPLPPPPPPRPPSLSEPLLEFATIATGPQSPLLRSSSSTDWDTLKFQAIESKSETVTETSAMGRQKSTFITDPQAPDLTSTPASSLPGLGRATCTTSSESCQPEQFCSAVAALSSMLRKQEKPKQKAKRPMNGFMLFSQKRRPELLSRLPGMNNSRDISRKLAKEWEEMDVEEKKRLTEEAKFQADLQKQQHPDCWKRKK